MKGFTLLELLIVVVMMAVVMVVAVPQFYKFNSNQALQTAAGELQTVVRTAQTNAASGVNCNSPGTTSSSDWHITFSDQKNYKMEATCNGSGTATLKGYSLPANVSISDINIEGCVDEQVNFQNYGVVFGNVTTAVTYGIPNPALCTGLALSNARKMTVTLWLDNNHAALKQLFIEKTGAVYSGSN